MLCAWVFTWWFKTLSFSLMGVSRRKRRKQKQQQSHVVSKSLENVSYRKHFCFRNKIGLGFWALLTYLLKPTPCAHSNMRAEGPSGSGPTDTRSQKPHQGLKEHTCMICLVPGRRPSFPQPAPEKLDLIRLDKLMISTRAVGFGSL